MKRTLLTAVSILVLACALSTGCKDNSVTPPAPPPQTTNSGPPAFQADVKPILLRHGCTGCHGGTNGLTVGTVPQLLAGGIHGPAVKPGNADSSLIVLKISPAPSFGSRMPLGGPYLTSAEIQVIKDWINAGAKDN